MAQVLQTKSRRTYGRDVFVAVCDISTRTIIELLYHNKQMSYTELLNEWKKITGKQYVSSGMFSYHIRKLKHYYMIDLIGRKFYTLSFKGRKIYPAIEIINQVENISINKYPTCLKIRVSDALTDEELLNEAVTRMITEVKKLK